MNNIPHFMEPRGSLTRSQEATAGLYLKPDIAVHPLFKIPSIMGSILGFRTKILYVQYF
jgi:hypothetical protein